MQPTLALVIAAVLAAVITPAGAGPQIAKEMQGQWCAIDPEYYARGSCEKVPSPGEDIEITADGFVITTPFLQCKATRITTFDVYPFGKSKGRNPWGPGYRITFKCIGETEGIAIEEWQIGKGDYLLVRLIKKPR